MSSGRPTAALVDGAGYTAGPHLNDPLMTPAARRPSRHLTFAAVLCALFCSHCGDPEKTPEFAPLGEASVSNEALPVTAKPLAARHSEPDEKRFRPIPATESGIDFVHAWRPEARYLGLLGNAMAGGGVAVGDLDGDDFPELVFTRPYGGTRLYQNLSAESGALRFTDITEDSGILPDRWGGGASFADLDNDGHQDLYVCGYDNANQLYWNEGKLPMREGAAAAGLAFNGSSIMMAFADYDLDGDLDGYLLTNRVGTESAPDFPPPDASGRVTMPEEWLEEWDVLHRPDGRVVYIPAAQYDHLYRNNGDGTFTDVSKVTGISGNHYGLSATWWDPDNDGWPDLYVANDFFGPDQLYLNRRDGTFVDISQQALPHTPWFSMGSDAGDVDGDLLQDFIASDMLGTTHERRHVTLTDLSDGRWFLEAAIPRQYMRNALFVNTGTPRFMEAAMASGLARSDWTWSTVFGDLDLDRRLDLFISNGMSRDYFNHDMRAEAEQTSDIMGEYWIHQDPLEEANLAFRNEGDLDFRSMGEEWGLDHVAASFGAGLADLDRDGDLDVFMNDFGSPPALFENRTNEGHSVELELRGHAANTHGVGARVVLTSRGSDGTTAQQVRHLALSHGYMAGAEPRLHFGLGDHDLVERLEIRWPGGRIQILEDLAADMTYRIREPLSDEKSESTPASLPAPLLTGFDGPSSTEQVFDDFARQRLLPARLSRLGPSLACGDLDGDGDDDLFLGGPSGSTGHFLVHTGEGLRLKSSEALEIDDYYEDQGALFLDTDSDGDQDLYVVSGGVEGSAGSNVYRDRLYLNNGSGEMARAPTNTLPASTDSGSAVVAADIDADGDLDLFVGSRSLAGAWPSGGTNRLLRNDSGIYTEITEEKAPGLAKTGRVTAALFSDVDTDGDLDLLVTHEWGPVRLWRNDLGVFSDDTTAAGLAELTGWWNGVAGTDIDHDGDIDYVVTNLGLGSRTRASKDEPAVLYFGDLDGSGIQTILETAWVHGELRPLRPRADALAVMPILAEDFPTNASWGAATVHDVFGAGALAKAGRLEATTSESGILQNDGTGRFTFQPLPRRAQVTASRGASFADLNGDGHPDLVLAQNDYSPQAEHGRLDGGLGLVLLGDGTGHWEPMRTDKSGFLVAGDGRAVSAFDLNGDAWADLAVSVNDGPMRLFEGLGPSTGEGLAVRLLGKPGNLAAAGARITFECEGLPPQTTELSAGSGALGQSAPVAWFGRGSAKLPGMVHVRWPDGSTSEHPVDAATNRITLSQP